DTHGWGWLASLETGLPFNVTDGLILEPQLQYIWQGLSLNNGHDNGGYVNFGDGSAQHLRAGLRFGSQSEMTFGNGTSTQAASGDSMKHSVSELPVNWWVRPSVIRTFSSDGDLSMGTAAAGSNVTFTPSQDGTSVDFQAGIDALIRQNVTLGIQGGYTRSVSGNSADGYNARASLKVSF
ncbi:autotransporter domain-containing protein, partial [Citrobacter sp. VF227]